METNNFLNAKKLEKELEKIKKVSDSMVRKEITSLFDNNLVSELDR